MRESLQAGLFCEALKAGQRTHKEKQWVTLGRASGTEWEATGGKLNAAFLTPEFTCLCVQELIHVEMSGFDL